MLVAQTKDLTSAQKQITAMVCIGLYIVLHTWFTSWNIYVDYEMQERGVGRKNMFLWTVIWCNLWPFYFVVTPCRKYIHVHVHIVHLTRLHTVVALTVWLHRACCLQETELDQKKADRHSLLKTCKVYTSLTMWEDGWVATLACWFRWRRLTYQWWGGAWTTLEMKRYSCCASFPLFSFCPSPSSPSSTSFSSPATPTSLPPSLHTPPHLSPHLLIIVNIFLWYTYHCCWLSCVLWQGVSVGTSQSAETGSSTAMMDVDSMTSQVRLTSILLCT